MSIQMGGFTLDAAFMAGMVFNPAVVIFSYYLGRRANQPQKLVLVAFGGYMIGLFLMPYQFSEPDPKQVKMAKFLFGFVVYYFIALFWAWLGYRTRAAVDRWREKFNRLARR